MSSGVTLTAEPGVTVKLSGSLTVNGTLDVNGTAADPVLFTSAQNTEPGQWYGITLATSSSTLDHAEVRFSRDGVVVSGGSSPVGERALHPRCDRMRRSRSV